MLRGIRVVAVFASFVVPAFAGGEMLVVNSTEDLPDADLLDGVCDADLEAEGQQITLRAAVMHSNVVKGLDTIELPAGEYKLTIKGSGEDEGATGDLDVFDDLTITGAGALDTIVNGKKAKDRVFETEQELAVTFEDFTIKSGSAPTSNDDDDSEGGGIESESDLTLRRMIITKCKVGDADGGGLAQSVGTLLVEDSLFSKNKSKDDGAGVDVASGTATFSRTSFVRNKAKGTGGGLEASPAVATVENCTFSANKATQGGGALSVKEGSDITLVNCTLAKNKSNDGSGIFEQLEDLVDDEISLANCIVSNKSKTNYSGDGLTSLGGNLDSGTTCGFASEGDLSDADPRLSKLTSGPGEPPVHPLKDDSPCIDAADDLQCPKTDQLGQARVDVPDVGTSVCDMGAVEFQPEG